MHKTVTVDDVDYAVQTITAGAALDIQEQFIGKVNDPKMTTAIVAASLGKSVEELRAMPWTHYREVINAALEVNGLMGKSDAPGETQAGASPAA